MKRVVIFFICIHLLFGWIGTSCKKGVTTTSNLNSTQVTTLAGPNFGGGSSSFNGPTGIAVDREGNVYVADKGNNVIREISPSGVVSTIAGNGQSGSTDGTPATASFNAPTSLALDAGGNVYVTDYGNNKIRLIQRVYSPSGTNFSFVSTFVPRIIYPYGIAVDTAISSFLVYASFEGTYAVATMDPGGNVSILAGSTIGSANGQGYYAQFDFPKGIATDTAGNVYVADSQNNLIRKVSPTGLVSTLAGDGSTGSTNGIGTTSVSFNDPSGVAVDKEGNVYVADAGNSLIRKIDITGTVTTLAGTGQVGSANGSGFASGFNHPSAVAVDSSGNVYVADTGNNMIRKISQQ